MKLISFSDDNNEVLEIISQALLIDMRWSEESIYRAEIIESLILITAKCTGATFTHSSILIEQLNDQRLSEALLTKLNHSFSVDMNCNLYEALNSGKELPGASPLEICFNCVHFYFSRIRSSLTKYDKLRNLMDLRRILIYPSKAVVHRVLEFERIFMTCPDEFFDFISSDSMEFEAEYLLDLEEFFAKAFQPVYFTSSCNRLEEVTQSFHGSF